MAKTIELKKSKHKLTFLDEITPAIYEKYERDMTNFHMSQKIQGNKKGFKQKSKKELLGEVIEQSIRRDEIILETDYFEDLCLKIEDEKGAEIKVSHDYLMERSISDYKQIREVCEDLIQVNF